jgi:K+-transporting ATPase KdpF subunit
MPSIGSEPMENIIVGIVSLAVLVYLFFTLIRPEDL